MPDIVSDYFATIASRLDTALATQREAMQQVIEAIVACAERDGRVYVFGTGHSHVLAEEVHYRAGGLAITVPVLSAPTMVHEGAVAGTVFERMSGIVAPIFERYDIRPGDVLVVNSNSGVNVAPLEAARLGRERGATVVAITSVEYSSMAAKGRERLADLADIVLDNGAPPGDGALDLPNSTLRVGPVSTVISVTIINAVLSGVAARLALQGEAPVYVSANMPGAQTINEDLVRRYRPRNPHL
jgi:uncharacterized phosphosugar-binding protein